MPQKSSPPMRTWGTRFDTLPSSPPLSPASREPSNLNSPPSKPSELPSSHPSPQKFKDERMPHDASVFVGSLPSTVDQQELARLLSEHLSEHTEVKNIKVVRDSKGGVCAFVQCEDAVSAATLIHTLHSNPSKSFLGRNLRYEPARAFRTLLVSYRTPTQYIPVNINRESQVHNNYHPHQTSQSVTLDLPFAMRIWKPANSKFHSLLYNNEAVNAENFAENLPGAGNEYPTLFLKPVAFDEETIHALASFFGRLESIALYPGRTDDFSKMENGSPVEPWRLYPAPHDSPRGPSMDTRCWEIKWQHRDDCVSALMTLRRVPHLTVTWSHQPTSHVLEHRPQYYNGHFQLNAPLYPLHIQNRVQLPRSQADISRSRVQSSPMKNEPSGNPSPVSRTDFTDTDFPPLTTSSVSGRGELGVWGDKFSRMDLEESPSQMIGEVDSSSTLASSKNERTFGGQYQDAEALPPTVSERSPITPNTPGSFTNSPTVFQDDSLKLSPKDIEGECSGHLTRSVRDLDPTTLFVGGLETFGPGAWDEEKVAKFFSRFGGLESVKVVRPQNSHAAFAFVKFDNTQSPARAVLEEHNRVYEGRAMRVQLRDCSHTRGYWRHNRGRGRFQAGFSSHRIPNIAEKESSHSPETRGQNNSVTMQKSPCSVEDNHPSSEPPAYSEQQNSKSVGDDEVNGSPVHPPSPSLPLSSVQGPQTESYREWYDEPSAAVTPPPPALGSSTSMIPYPVPTGYYGPPQWVQPYAPQLQYQLPYMSYPSYRPPGPPFPHSFLRTGPEMPAPAAPVPWPHIGVYGSYIPYQTPAVRTTNLDPSASQTLSSRAPLAPTGFIQNDQGTLIAVYQPEALDQYMAGSSVPPTPVSQNTGPSIQWPQFSQPQPYHFSGPAIPPRCTVPGTSSVNWLPNHSLSPAQHSTPAVAAQANALPNVGLRHEAGGHSHLQLRRQAGRRDNYYHHGRNNHGRPITGRNPRGNTSHAGYHPHNDSHTSRVAHLIEHSL